MTRVMIDACVLYPTVLREIVLAVAAKGLFVPQWSPRIIEEWVRATAKLGKEAPILARGEAAALAMRWPEAAVEPRQRDAQRLWLPDQGDIHVLAAAIAGSSDIILTLNIKDFPAHILAEEGVGRIAPDPFLMGLHALYPEKIHDAVLDVMQTARAVSNIALTTRGILKKARLPRLGKALQEI